LDKDKVLLEVRNLVACIETGSGLVKAVDDVSFDVRKGEIVGLVGESGCGKTMTALSIMRLLPEPFGRIVGGSIYFEGQDLTKLTEEEMRAIRGNKISIIFQDPLTALNPIMKIGEQIVEAIVSHRKVDKNEAKRRAIELLHSVGIPDGEVIASQYPFRVSGGMRQRVVIATAIANKPRLLIADEPTTNLDVTVQAQILDLLRGLKEKYKMSLLLITHNLGVVAETADRVYVMYGGRIAETADVNTIFEAPMHPYTQLLLRAVPNPLKRIERLESIPGTVPNLIDMKPGCPFAPRCPFAMEICRKEDPPRIDLGNGHVVHCWLHAKR